ncbi:MAG: hypothetical protein QNJ75_05710 [Acidimicrobiia bacterium]|nr:hypothetical protein [Acidimicrobiia bacterium]
MGSGNGMRNGDRDSAVRILPNEAAPLTPPLDSESASRHRWYLPLAAVVGVVAIFGLATRPGGPAPTTTTTPPARIADVDAAMIDLRTAVTAPIADEWVTGFEWNGEVNDIIRASSSFVAVGGSDQGAQVWLSGTGSTWRLLPRLDRPDGPSSIDHVVYRDNYTVALGSVAGGVGLWTANEVSAWKYHGIIEEMGETSIIDLVSGPNIVAVAFTPHGKPFIWTSTNGVDWSEVGELDVSSELVIAGFTADDDFYYLFGQHDCANTPCDPEIWRSVDGRTWESVGSDLRPETGGGMVTDIAVTRDGLRAVGWLESGDQLATHVWESRNGRDWRELPRAAEQIRQTHISLELVATGLEPSPWAHLIVAGNSVDVAIGSIIETDTGQLMVDTITAGSVVISGPSGRDDGIAVGETLQLQARPDPRHIAAEGPRIVVTGYMQGSLGVVETAWLSVDGGTTWAAQHFPEIYGDINAITAGANIVVHGEVGGAPAVWRNAWDTEAAGLLAEELVGDYVSALTDRDAERLISVLPRWDDRSAPPQLSIPTLGDYEPGWWDETTGDILGLRVQDTLDYLAITESDIRLQACESVVALGALDRVSVRCDYTADSAMLSMFGLEEQPGRINAVVRNGRLSELHLDAAPSTALWRVLANYTDIDAHRNASLAAAHLAAAEESLSQVLHPGSTRIVDTALGTMEWTWLESVELGESDYISSVTWSDLGFVAVGYTEGSRYPETTVWQSSDGRSWTELPAPEDVEGVWDLKPFAGGLLGQAWFEGKLRLVHFDGTAWSDVAIPPPDSSVHQELSRIAVSGDRALVVTWWDGPGGIIHNGAVLNTDLEAISLTLPEGFSTPFENSFELAGSEAGFVVAVGDYYGTVDDLALWTSSDGTDWRLLAQTSSLDNAQYIWNLQQHRSQYFVVGDTLEMHCSPRGEEGNCTNVVGLWSSTDGVDWERVRTETGEPMATRAFGSGPLGLIAFGQELMDTAYPRSVFMSRDGEAWTTAGGLTLLDTAAEWWWSSIPAIGEDTVITAGHSYRTNIGIDTAEPFLIIGRLLDG